jgi:uncharacterized iron-regulated membrane protein
MALLSDGGHGNHIDHCAPWRFGSGHCFLGFAPSLPSLGGASMFKNSRSAHRAIVPIAAAPLILTAITGILFSLLEARDIELEWLLALHIGHFGPLDLEPFYSVILGICVLVLSGSGLSLWFKTRRKAS